MAGENAGAIEVRDRLDELQGKNAILEQEKVVTCRMTQESESSTHRFNNALGPRGGGAIRHFERILGDLFRVP